MRTLSSREPHLRRGGCLDKIESRECEQGGSSEFLSERHHCWVQDTLDLVFRSGNIHLLYHSAQQIPRSGRSFFQYKTRHLEKRCGAENAENNRCAAVSFLGAFAVV